MKYRYVYYIAFLLVFCSTLALAENELINQPVTGTAKKVTSEDKKERSRIIETGNEVIIDGSVRVLEANFTKYLDLVEISTPTTPAANHAKIFLTSSTVTGQQLSIIFDDGTVVKITNN